jgi:hypothetical protein
VLALEIVGGLIVALLLVGTFLRIRKLRRDEMRELSRPVERRLFSPPPSPYAPSKGFRLLDESGQPLTRPPIERPRLDPNRRYVFNELSGANEDTIASHTRHNDDWFLSRSSQRSTISRVLRGLAVFVVIALVVATVATYYVDHRSPKKKKVTTTTTTFPLTLKASRSSGDDVFYNVHLARYLLVVRGLTGATSVTVATGPSNTVQFSGTVQKGDVEALMVTGNSRVRIGTPSVASAHVQDAAVIFPSPLPRTLVLVFTSTSPASSS